MTLHEIIHVIFFHLKKIIIFTFISTLIIFCILFFIYPITYSSQVSLLPPEESTYGGLDGILNNQDLVNILDFGQTVDNSQLFAEILKSRTASQQVVEKLNLINFFKVDNLQEATEKLQDIINVKVTKERLIVLEVYLSTSLFSRFSDEKDSVRILSAKVANSFVEVLDKINREKMNLKAKRTREFIEQQLAETKLKSDDAETQLKIFKEKNKAISLPEQVRATIDNAAKIKSEIIFTEIELKTLQTNFDTETQQVKTLRTKLDALNKKYYDMERGLDKDYFPGFTNLPELTMQLAILNREFHIQNELYLLLKKQYYQEMIKENKDFPTIEVLDEAIPPLKANSPRLVFHTIIGAIFSFLIISTIILISESYRKKIKDII
ncbi:MAG: hypothetical protein JW866_00605 [Ignavibacteriales bacterium]|nr:hypothetical protein [Ignavibacteriales bacterium]